MADWQEGHGAPLLLKLVGQVPFRCLFFFTTHNMNRRAGSGYIFPLAATNPSDLCWLNSLIALLSIFGPFQRLLATENEGGPVTKVLRSHFKRPSLNRAQKLIEAATLKERLREALVSHQRRYPDSAHVIRLLHVFTRGGFHDPAEIWNHLYGILRDELGILKKERSNIGVHVRETLSCTTCFATRELGPGDQQNSDDYTYRYEALALYALSDAQTASIQDALQFIFAEEPDVQARCCDGERNVPHIHLLECLQGSDGLALYGPFNEEKLHAFVLFDWHVNQEIYLPFNGHSSGRQSVYQLTGFTARLIDKSHHVAVLYDNKGHPWTYDDGIITRGTPTTKWVPGVIMYEKWQDDVAGLPFFRRSSQDGDVDPGLHPDGEKENDARSLEQIPKQKRGHPVTSLAKDVGSDFSDAAASPTPSVASENTGERENPKGSSARSGRARCPTNFYKPGDTKTEKAGEVPVTQDSITAVQRAISKTKQKPRAKPKNTQPGPQNCVAQPSQSTCSSVMSNTVGSLQERESNHTLERPACNNPLVDQYPLQTWAWVRDAASHRLAQVLGVATEKSMRIKWAHKPGCCSVSNKRFLRKVTLAEERIVFGLPRDQGRFFSLQKVEALLKSQGGVSFNPSSTQTQSDDTTVDACSGIVFTPATTNWDSLACFWLAKHDSSFDPYELIGSSVPLPSTVPEECFNANHDFPAHPSFCNCVREVALVLQQLDPQSRLYQQLFAWIHLLPIILLRAPASCKKKELVKLVSKRCTLFLQGEWELLYKKACLDVLKIVARTARQQCRDNSSLVSQAKIQHAINCIRRGNLGKGARTLTGSGTSKDLSAYAELSAKHPQDVEPAFFPSDYVPPPLPEEKDEELARCLSLPNLARVASNFPAESHPDQWGWRPREYIGNMLHDPVIGDLLWETLIQPRYLGALPHLYGESYRGGQLLALSKAPKPGSRPIAIGDCFRRVLDKALQPLSKNELTSTFENTFHNVKQFASGSKDGAEKYVISVLLALGPDLVSPGSQNAQSLDDDPVAVMILDTENAFNRLHRQVVFDMITGQFEGSYAQGRLTRENVTKLPDVFSAHIPSIRGHYEGDGRLVFVDHAHMSHEIKSRTGTQQGCVMGGKLFNIGTFSVVGATMADHPAVYCPTFSDNMALVGRMSKLFHAADDLRTSLLEIGLPLQPADSALYIPSYNNREAPPPLLQDLRTRYPELSQVPWSREGILLLGCPLGTDAYVQAHFEQVCSRIAKCSEDFAVVDDGLIHLQLHKLSVNVMLPYFLRTTDPALSASYAQRIDGIIWEALLAFSDVSDLDINDPAMSSALDDARRQAAMRLGEGGFGITPNECVTVPAFYSAVSRALRFSARCGFQPVMDFLASDSFRSTPLCESYLKARRDLIEWGAQEPAELEGVQNAPEMQAPTEGNPKKQQKPPILPKLEGIVAHPYDEQLIFPEQKALTRLVQKANPRWSPDGLSDEGKTRTKHLSTQHIKAKGGEGDETAAYLQTIAGFEDEQQILHSPLAFLSHTSSLQESFPKDVFSVLFGYLLGLPASPCLQRREVPQCEVCNEPLDRFGHHRMQCSRTAAYHAAHKQVAMAVEEIARKSGVPFSDKGVPCHLTSQKVGDALCALSSDSRKLVLDYTVVHPRLGKAGCAGQWHHDALANKVRQKWSHHGRQYAVIGFAFAPIAVTTYGRMHGHFLRLLYILAKKQTHLVHAHHRPFTQPDTLFGRLFAQSRARIGAAVAKGMALRALGVSSLGVSKVFLRHIAPALYRDEYLSAGPHLSAGHMQWQLVLSQ